MCKGLFFSVFLLALYGCATPAPQSPSTAALLNFDDLAAEITVQHEVIESTAAVHQDANRKSTD